MIKEENGRVVKGLGGLYEIRLSTGERVSCRARGSLHRDDEKLLIGDNVRVVWDSDIPDSMVIDTVYERKNSLIRPPLANLDYIFITFAAKKPAPVLETVDKLLSIAEHNNIKSVIVITKSDIDKGECEKYKAIYELAGYPVFITSSEEKEGVAPLLSFINNNIRGGALAAFAGASGVGKSTLMNSLFPSLTLATAEISRKIERGRHTTRHVEIFPLSDGADAGLLADTPGFSLIDFARFDFFSVEELEAAFPDIAKYKGRCRYADCAHCGEGAGECAVALAMENGRIAESRLFSYRAIYQILKNKNKYD